MQQNAAKMSKMQQNAPPYALFTLHYSLPKRAALIPEKVRKSSQKLAKVRKGPKGSALIKCTRLTS